jgi:hypothetical protein
MGNLLPQPMKRLPVHRRDFRTPFQDSIDITQEETLGVDSVHHGLVFFFGVTRGEVDTVLLPMDTRLCGRTRSRIGILDWTTPTFK